MASELVTLFKQKMLIQEKMINSLPNEMLRAVLDKLDATELIGLRGVSRRWQAVIEDICRKKRSIVIVGKDDEIYVKIPDVSDCFNGLVRFNQNCAFLKVKFGDFTRILVSTHICALLVKLFHQIENLIILSLDLTVTGTTKNFIFLLKQWSATIVNLHLPYGIFNVPQSVFIELSDQIDNLTSLKRLHAIDVDCLKPTTCARLVHCSLHIDDLLKIVPHLGSSCTSLTLFGHVSLDTLTQMHKLNARLVESVTHLSLMTENVSKHVLSFVCSNFMALQMLDLEFPYSNAFDAYMIANLARLSNLSQLTIKPLKMVLSTLAWSTNLPTLNSIQILSIPYFNVQNGDQQFSCDQFCRIVSRIFPNLQQLTIEHEDELVRDGISLRLNHFRNLGKHVIVSI